MKRLALALLVASPALAQELTPATYERWRDYLLPPAQDEVWLEIGWRMTLWDGLREAQAEHKPLLLWAMNGHPLGCT
jgi:hypothetical protein